MRCKSGIAAPVLAETSAQGQSFAVSFFSSGGQRPGKSDLFITTRPDRFCRRSLNSQSSSVAGSLPSTTSRK